MSDSKTLRKKARLRSGSFTDVADSLLPLFSDSRGHDERRWHVLFGIESPRPPGRAVDPPAAALGPHPARRRPGA